MPKQSERDFLFSLLPTLEGIQSTSYKEINYIGDGKMVGVGTNNNYYSL